VRTGAVAQVERHRDAVAFLEGLDVASDRRNDAGGLVAEDLPFGTPAPIQFQSPCQACQSLRQIPHASVSTIT